MVAGHALLLGKWSIEKFNATIINDIWLETLFFTLVATVVSVVSEKVHSLAFSNSLLTILGLVLGLVLSFRTSSAYERYQEGRKLWSNITLASRNLGELLWIHVPIDGPERDNADGQRGEAARLKAVIEKKSMINLVQAFSVSVKHFLRAEPGIFYKDLYRLVSFLPSHLHTTGDALPMWHNHKQLSQTARSASTHATSMPAGPISSKGSKRSEEYSDVEKALLPVQSEIRLREACNPPKATVYDYVPFLSLFKPIAYVSRKVYRLIFKKREDTLDASGSAPADTRGPTGKTLSTPLIHANVPLEITLFLNSYIQWLIKKKLVQHPAIATAMVSNLSSLQEAVTNLERVRDTPIPFAYQAHLRMSLWVYLFFLPSQLYAQMHYLTIPGTCFTAFLLLGFFEIGRQIENPFGYDPNDLDMDSFCLAIERELHEITALPAADPHTYIFSDRNRPFEPTDCRTGKEIALNLNHEYNARDTGMDYIGRTMLRNWRKVEEG